MRRNFHPWSFPGVGKKVLEEGRVNFCNDGYCLCEMILVSLAFTIIASFKDRLNFGNNPIMSEKK